MFEAGLFEGRRVELIGGEVTEMSPQNSVHAAIVTVVGEVLRRVFSRGFVIRELQPLLLGLDSDPEPDVAVVRGKPRDFVKRHPSSAVLIVEVADSSLEHDRKRKSSLYAQAGIPEYWIVNLPERKLEVFRRPGPSAGEPLGHAYASVQALGPDASVAAIEAPGAPLRVEELLP